MIVERLTEDLPVHLHGSLILQELLKFSKPIQVSLFNPPGTTQA